MKNRKFTIENENIKQCPKCGNFATIHLDKCQCGYAYNCDSDTTIPNTKPKQVESRTLGRALPTAQKMFKDIKALHIKITRGYKAKPLDYDNLVGGCKALRDEIARALGIDDAESGGVIWEYLQEKGSLNKIEIYQKKRR